MGSEMIEKLKIIWSILKSSKFTMSSLEFRNNDGHHTVFVSGTGKVNQKKLDELRAVHGKLGIKLADTESTDECIFFIDGDRFVFVRKEGGK